MNKKFRKILVSLDFLLPLSKVEMFIDGKSKKILFRTGLILDYKLLILDKKIIAIFTL